MSPHVQSLESLIENGLRPARDGALAKTTEAGRQLNTLAKMQQSDLHDATKFGDVCVGLSMLTRHLIHEHSFGFILDCIVASYIIFQGAAEQATVVSMRGGLLSWQLYTHIMACNNPLFWKGDVPLSLQDSILSLNCHTVLKSGDPFRDDPFTQALVKWWVLDHDVELDVLMLTFVLVLVVRSEILIQFFLDNPGFYMHGPDALPRLYTFALSAGTQLGDQSTAYSCSTRLGEMIDNICVPFWANASGEPIRLVVAAKTLRSATRIMAKVRGMEDMNLSHSMEYILIVEKSRSRLIWSAGTLTYDICSLGSHANSFLQLRLAAKAPSAATSTYNHGTELKDFVSEMRSIMPDEVVYAKADGSTLCFQWKQHVSAMVLKATSCKVVQMLQMFLTGSNLTNTRSSCINVWVRRCPRPSRKRKTTV